MQIPLLHQQIILNTEKIRELHLVLMQHSGSIPTEELDRFIAEIRKLYESALELQQHNSIRFLDEMQSAVRSRIPVTVAPHTLKEEEKTSMPTIPVPVEKVLLPSEPFVSPVAEVQAPSVTPADPLASDPLHAEMSVKNEGTKNGKKKFVGDIHGMFEENKTLANSFHNAERIGDKLAKEPGRRLSDQIKTPVKDLRQAIGLNEKFQFINQLFHGDSGKYNAAIDFLNTCGTMEAATSYIDGIASTNNWEDHASSALAFMEWAERRYMA